MFLKRFAALTAVLAIGVAACAGQQSVVQDPLPHGTALSSSGAQLSAGTANGVTGSVTVNGSGNANASESSSAPNSLPAIQSATRAAAPQATQTGRSAQSVKPEATANTPLVYVAITASAASTISGLASSSFAFTTLPAGSFYLAEYSAALSQWVTISGPGTVAGSTVTFGAVTFSPSISLAAGASLYLAVYTGGTLATPTPTPSPSPTPTHSASPSPSPSATATATASASAAPLGDTGFESNNVTALGGAIGSSGWTQCSVSAATAGTYTGGINGSSPYSAATAPPVSIYTPTPGTTPAAVIAMNGASAPGGTHAPVPTQTTVPVSAGSYAAQFGEIFSNYNASNYGYNGLCEVVNAGSNGATLTAQVFSSTNEASAYVEDLIGTVTGTNSAAMTLSNILYMENIETASVSTDSGYRQVGPLTLPAGQSTLFIGMWTKSGSGSGSTSYSGYWWVDGITVTNN